MLLVVVSKDWHSNSPLLVLIAYAMLLVPTKKSGIETAECKSICGFRAEAPFLLGQGRWFWPWLFGFI